MVTNYPHRIDSHDVRSTGATADQAEDGFGTTVFDRVRQVVCAIHGHDHLLQFEQDRMFLRCASCGHESPGWELSETPPTVTIRGDARRHAIARPQLVGARRIA